MAFSVYLVLLTPSLACGRPNADASVLESESHSLTLNGLSDIAHHPGHSECDLETWRLGFGGCLLARSPLA